MSKAVRPPKLPNKLFEWYCNSSAAEDLIGDMEEIFYQNTEKMSVFKAKRKYWSQTFVLLFSYAVKRRRSSYSKKHSNVFGGFEIFKNYTKVAGRSLIRQKFFTIINILGLSIGMSIGLLALAAYMDMLEVDQFHTNREQLYRVTSKVDDLSDKRTYASSSAPVADILKNEASGVEEVVRINRSFNPEVRSGNATIPLQGYFADQSFLNVFTFPLQSGDVQTALSEPYTLVITEEAAQKLFDVADPVGKMVMIDGVGEFKITGLLQNHPRSHFLFEVLTSFKTLEAIEKENDFRTLNAWGPVTNYFTYFQISPDADLASIQSTLDQSSVDHFKNEEFISVQYGIQNIMDIYKTDHANETGLAWGYMSITIFFMLAFLILIPACFNYTNISISRALKRSKEIGLRKVVGGQRGQIFTQFITETVIISTISLVGGVYLFTLVRNEFLQMIVQGKKSFDLEITWETGLAFVGFALFTGVIAGIFPAMYFSKLSPIETLRNSLGSKKLSKLNLRKSLLVAQFTISLVFILGVAIIIKQHRYSLNYDLGFDKENILDVQLRGVDPQIFRNEFEKIPEVSSISMSSSFPGSWMAEDTYVHKPGQLDSLSIFQMFIDQQYIDNMRLELLAGRNFPEHMSKNEEYIIVNEQFLVSFDLKNPSDALEQIFVVEGGKELRVLGVVKDFNYVSIRNKIESFFFRYDPDKYVYANLKLNSTEISATLGKLENTWKTVAEDDKFEARFLNDELQDALVSFISMVKIFGFMGLLAISISCLGLLAMVVFDSENRIKEMGVRKVLGASVFNIAYSLSGSFVKLLLIAVVIAVPITYFFFDKIFLRIHHYRDNIGITEIVLGVLAILVIGFATIISQAIKTALSNPVDSLKYE